jgi:methylthioribose-1-phosphate isomerase
MKVQGKHYRTIWLKEGGAGTAAGTVQIINQALLPHRFEIMDLSSLEDMRRAIKDMYLRGAGLIGAAAAWGMYLASREAGDSSFGGDMEEAAKILKATRPTASNLAWAVDRILDAMGLPGGPGAGNSVTEKQKAALQEAALREARAVSDEDAECCRRIGLHGLEIIKALSAKKRGETVNILTHCNAGWLAFVDYGSALSPVYAAFDRGIKIHVWVDETRPRCQGASLTAWELGQHGLSHDLIADNAGGHLMQRGLVDMVIVGADRVTRRGDAANKIGTYLKALAARENGVPFYVAFPSSTFDFSIRDGVAEIPIEERDPEELRFVSGKASGGGIETVQICPDTTPARNWGFDVTPGRYISALITERGSCPANEEGILSLYPEQRKNSYKSPTTNVQFCTKVL